MIWHKMHANGFALPWRPRVAMQGGLGLGGWSESIFSAVVRYASPANDPPAVGPSTATAARGTLGKLKRKKIGPTLFFEPPPAAVAVAPAFFGARSSPLRSPQRKRPHCSTASSVTLGEKWRYPPSFAEEEQRNITRSIYLLFFSS
jgi:hypothetical protein